MDTDQRLDLIEARIGIITKGLSVIIADLGNIDDVELAQGDRPWNPDQICWVETTGRSGPYFKATEGQDYELLVKDLKSHGNKFQRDGFFYWLFEQTDAVGRKKV